MWSCIAGGLKIKVTYHTERHLGTKSSGLISKGGLKIKSCKIEGLLYMITFRYVEAITTPTLYQSLEYYT